MLDRQYQRLFAGAGILVLIGACSTRATVPPLGLAMTTLPNSWTILALGDTVFGVAPDGLLRWSKRIPDGDRIVTPIAAAANGTVYLRGAATLHALLPTGRWLWSSKVSRLPAALRPQDVPIYAPVALSDSTVALVTDSQEVTALTQEGKVRWRRKVDGTIVAPPRSAADGHIIVYTGVGLFGLSPEGKIDWHTNPTLGQAPHGTGSKVSRS